MSKYQVLLFYKYVEITDPEKLKMEIKAFCDSLQLKGRILIAEEGINGTVGGLVENTEEFADYLKKIPELSDMKIKRSESVDEAFPRMSVKVRNEIVGTRFPKDIANPIVKTAPYISADELKKWFSNNEDFEIVDMRNNYEFEVGHFKNSINPKLNNSRDLPEKIEELKPIKNKKILTVCTGGIRCEKMSAYLLSQGFDNVYQLEDGMHGYMEKYPGEDFLGGLYTFDQRVVMHFGGEREIVGKCHFCNSSTENYANCANPNCNLHFLVCDNCKNTDSSLCCKEECALLLTK
jgi:UPF0176 protein